MRLELLRWLVCPACRGPLVSDPEPGPDEDVVSGRLECQTCDAHFPIHNGIPRFVGAENYASSFGLQWNRFRREQLDSMNGFTLSRDRFVSETTFTPERLSGLTVLDVGCGAGRFLDIAGSSGAAVVGVDITTAVDAARENLTDRANIHLVQASVYELPFKAASFDLCYCIGVIQHTPDPEQTVRSLPRVLTAGGILALTAYERRRWTKLNGKYLARRLLRRVRPETLMKALVYTMPALFPLTELLFRIPVIGRFAAFAIPVANYVRVPQLSLRQRYRWSIMDTFDMLAPAYDVPQRYQDISRVLRAAGMVDIRRLPARGLCVLSRKESR